MKKFIKSRIFSFLLGAIIFSAITVYAGTLMNSNEVNFTPKNNKWNVTKVDEALNSLYSVAVPEEYSGTTSVTPTYSDITLNTQDKLLKNNITISGIPSTYKNLTNTTTATAADLATGKTAYNSDGSLITGTAIIGSNCISGTYSKPANSEWNIPIGFIPSKVFLSMVTSEFKPVYFMYDSSKASDVFTSFTRSSTTKGARNYNEIIIGSNITSTFSSSDSFYKENFDINYIACK